MAIIDTSVKCEVIIRTNTNLKVFYRQASNIKHVSQYAEMLLSHDPANILPLESKLSSHAHWNQADNRNKWLALRSLVI